MFWGLKTKKFILIWILALFMVIFLLSFNASALTKEECESGGGNWMTPQIASPGEPEKDLQPYCKCDIGFYWNEISKKCEDDSETRCIQTQGKWIDGKCQCPEGTIKWTQGFGCDTKGPIPTSNLDSQINNKKSFNQQYIIYGILAIAVVFIIWIILRKRKNETK